MSFVVSKKTDIRNLDKFPFEDLLIYQRAKDLSIKTIIYFSNSKIPYNYQFLVGQLLKSVSSIAANIAEGYGRHYQKNYRQFLSIARGSCFETHYWFDLANSLKKFDNKIVDEFIRTNIEISKMLTVMMKKLNTT